MNNRVSIKVTGAQGQGVNSVGEVVAKGLKRSGYCVFGYREYMSLIKGGHSSYQLDVGNEEICSTETLVDILVCFNHHGLERNWDDVKRGGIILHQTPQWKFPPAVQRRLRLRKITVVYLPVEEILREYKFSPIFGNMLIISVVWALLGRDAKTLKQLAFDQFKHKGEIIIERNYRCIDTGQRFKRELAPKLAIALPRARARWRDCMLLTGSHALGLGIIHAGCRLYAGYPMTPSSPLLSFIAGMQNRTGMVIKQAEDEITAAQIMSGAMLMGTRAMTATSGGGFDLMTETLSLNGILENPSVFGLAMRPGPATGLPTWTGQGDLLLAVNAGHGELPRCVISVSDSFDAFHLMPAAFNLAEEYQLPVIVMYDKQISEAVYTQPAFDQRVAQIKRGSRLVLDAKKLKGLSGADRYDPSAKNGVSFRWLPGADAATYAAQGDEHSGDGTVDESAENAVAQADKRMRKMTALKAVLPEPTLYVATEQGTRILRSDPNLDLLLVGWGSTKGPVLDVLESLRAPARGRPRSRPLRVGYLHYTYLWPLRGERYARLMARAGRAVLVEGNHQGQLGMLLQQESCVPIKRRVLKYDGRPFFTDELYSLLQRHI
jgi:2-oxoglutarate ferredoxin oxidoreductase subunit alpha